MVLQGATQKPCHKRCQLVLGNKMMVNTYTKIKLEVLPYPAAYI